MHRIKASVGAVLAAGLLCYPVLVYFGLSHLGPRLLALFVLIAAAARLALIPAGSRQGTVRLVLPSAGAAILLAGLVMSTGISDFLLYYPVFVNGAMLAIFGVSLVRPPSLVEKLARLRTAELSAGGVAYTRKVTAVWCGFFLVNGSIALATAMSGDVEAWTLYNGLISYMAIGVLAGGELLVRRCVMQRAVSP